MTDNIAGLSDDLLVERLAKLAADADGLRLALDVLMRGDEGEAEAYNLADPEQALEAIRTRSIDAEAVNRARRMLIANAEAAGAIRAEQGSRARRARTRAIYTDLRNRRKVLEAAASAIEEHEAQYGMIAGLPHAVAIRQALKQADRVLGSL